MDAEIARAIADDLAGKPVPLVIERKRSRHPLAVYVMPVPFSGYPAEHFLSHACALVLVIDPDTDAPPDPALVRDLLGLTLGEARVAALIGGCLFQASESIIGAASTGGRSGAAESPETRVFPCVSTLDTPESRR